MGSDGAFHADDSYQKAVYCNAFIGVAVVYWPETWKSTFHPAPVRAAVHPTKFLDSERN
jgi:hypothetical protein